MIRKTLFSLIIAGIGFSASAAPALPIVKVDGKEYYSYNATKDDSLYGIAKLYGWDLGLLVSTNPDVEGALKSNQRILYPVSAGTDMPGESVIRHKVKSGETIYGISKRYGVSIESIYRSNPEAKNGIHPNDIILLRPGQTTDSNEVLYEVKQGDTLFSLSKRFNTKVEIIIKSNPGLNDSNLMAGSVIKVFPGENEDNASLQKAQNSSNRKVEDNQKPIEKQIPVNEECPEETEISILQIAENTPKEKSAEIAIILSQDNNKRDSEFARGVLTALESMKNSGERINLTILPGSISKLEESLSDQRLAKSEVIIATYDKDFPESLRDYASENSKKLFNVFDIKEDYYLINTEMVHILPGSDYFNGKISEDILKRFNGFTYIFIGKDNTDAIGKTLEETVLPVDKTNILTANKLSTVDITDQSKIVVYSYDTKKSDIKSAVENVASLRAQYPLADIVLVGRPNWIVYDDSMKDEFAKADTYIPSRFYFNPEGLDEKDFINSYKAMFNHAPTRSFPMYSVMGYDLMRYIAKSINNNSEFPWNPSEIGFAPLQLDFNLNRTGDEGGYLNEVVYMLRFAPYGSIDKIRIK